MLNPAALYTERAVAPIHIPTTLAPSVEEKTDGGGDEKTQGDDDGRWVAFALGMEVWEAEAAQEANGSRSRVPSAKLSA